MNERKLGNTPQQAVRFSPDIPLAVSDGPLNVAVDRGYLFNGLRQESGPKACPFNKGFHVTDLVQGEIEIPDTVSEACEHIIAVHDAKFSLTRDEGGFAFPGSSNGKTAALEKPVWAWWV